MKWKFLLDFLIIFLLSFLIVGLIFNPKEKQENIWKLIVDTSSNDYTVPNAPILSIQNNTDKNVSFNTCENIKIKFAWDFLNPKDNLTCEDIELKTWESKSIDYSKDYKNFIQSWNYFFEVNIDSKEYLIPFDIENKWFFGKFFSFFLYAPLYNFMVFLIDIFSGSIWWAIIIVTVFIRILLLWPQHRMMISQRKLQLIQPKIKEIQEKHKWNHQMLWMNLMELYKKEKVSPMWSCGMILLQMPVLMVIYRIIISIQDFDNAYYLYPSLANFDIWSISSNFYWLDLLSNWWLILALIVWFIQFIQIKLSLSYNKKPNTNSDKKWLVLEKKLGQKDYSNFADFMPDQETMWKMMLIVMPIMVTIFTYTFLAWIGIYWWITTLFMIIQQLIVNKIIKK